ncbi:MAG: aminoacyl-tRNA hydrolase [Trizodia sp. TS-e1964]|nr:MAG: aminoacyl-tRNA hydrolase [Trizodia sp. TS-e1964]
MEVSSTQKTLLSAEADTAISKNAPTQGARKASSRTTQQRSTISNPLSHRACRRLRQHPLTPNSSPENAPPPRNPNPPALVIMSSPPALLLLSLGNPGAAHATTLHSAGHVFLWALRSHLALPPFTPSPSLPTSASTDPALPWTLCLSGEMMNVSGRAAKAAWKRRGRGARLVIVHDEMEAALGAFVVREGGSSAR